MNRQSDIWKYTNHLQDLLCGKYLHDLTKLSGFNVCLLIWKKPLASLCHLQHKFCSLKPVVVHSVMLNVL